MKNSDGIKNFLNGMDQVPYSREFTDRVMMNIGHRNIIEVWSVIFVSILWLAIAIWTWVNIDKLITSVQDIVLSFEKLQIPSGQLDPYSIFKSIMSIQLPSEAGPYFIFIGAIIFVGYITIDCFNNILNNGIKRSYKQ